MLGSRIAGGNTAYKRVESDYYPTPPEATQALIDALKIGDMLHDGDHIWEPACGDGHMVSVLQNNGFLVTATDILTGEDYLATEKPDGVNWIITNPPFSLAEEFIRRSLEHNVPFALLLKSQFWHAKKRFGLYYEHPPAYILPLTWRPDFLFKSRGKGSPLMDVMWCVWLPGAEHSATYIPLRKPAIEESEDATDEGERID